MQRRNGCAQVDAHVEDGEARVAAHVSSGIELAHDGADVRLQQPGAENQQQQSQIEKWHAGNAQAELAQDDQDSAVKNGPALSEDLVGHPAARHAEKIDHRRVQAVDDAGGGDAESQAAARGRRGHEEDQDGAHPIEAESLPHFCEEQCRQAAGMAEKSRVRGGSGPGMSSCGHSHTSIAEWW